MPRRTRLVVSKRRGGKQKEERRKASRDSQTNIEPSDAKGTKRRPPNTELPGEGMTRPFRA